MLFVSIIRIISRIKYAIHTLGFQAETAFENLLFPNIIMT